MVLDLIGPSRYADPAVPLTSEEASALARLPRAGAVGETLNNQRLLARTAQIIGAAIEATKDARLVSSLASSLARVAQSHDGCVHRVRMLRGKAWIGTAKAPPADSPKKRPTFSLAPESIGPGVSGESSTVGAGSGAGEAVGSGAVQVTPPDLQPPAPTVSPETIE